MATTIAALELYAGESIAIAGTVEDSSASAVDITGWATTQLTWRLALVGASTAAVEYTIGSGITLDTPASGTFDIAVAAADTSGLATGTYRQHMIATDDSGNTDVIWTGAVTVNAVPASPS